MTLLFLIINLLNLNLFTNELLLTVTKKKKKKYTESNPYKYQNSVKHIRVEIDGMKQNKLDLF